MSSKKVLSVFSLVMINVIAVDSLRTLPLSAPLGIHLLFFYFVAALAFFIPVALISAELATAYPNTGGIYVWVREAFGKKAAFITIWLQWIYNVVWYPTIMAFIAATAAYLFDPLLANHKIYLLCTTVSLFWLFTLLNCFGMRFSGLISALGASIGTLLPMIGIIVLGALWLWKGNPVEIDVHTSWLPNFHDFSNLSLFSIVLFGLLGMEMSATHAEEVKNPQRDYPRALLYSTILIFLTLVLGSLAIAVVVPQQQLSVVSGLIDAFSFFFNAYHLSYLVPLTALLIILGGLCGVSAWIIGPAKGLLVAANDKSIPLIFTRTNRYGVPTTILLAQGIIFTLLSSVYIFFDTINAAYWALSELAAQLALLAYIFMFAAAIKLRYTRPNQKGAYQIPGGKPVLLLVAGTGLLCCFITILIGFIPPAQISIGNTSFFKIFLGGGLLLFVGAPWLWIYTPRKSIK